jgi:3-deoxy-D-manno-octulosonic-acid transferase
MSPPALAAYRLATGLAEPFLPLVLSRRAARGKEDTARLPERLGRAATPRPDGPLVWMHGASVGEGLSLLPVVEALRAQADAPAVLVTSGTTTSAALLGARLPPGALHQYAPVDAPGAARRFLAHWRPDACVFAESEVWPNLLGEARARGIPTALMSARLSRGSLSRWTRAPRSARSLFAGFDLVLAQDDATARALADLGARDDGRLNLKLCGAPLAPDPAVVAAADAALGDMPVIVAASTHPGEEEILLDAFAELGRPGVVLLITPRHPERGAAVQSLAKSRDFGAQRRSAGDPLDGCAAVYVADTLGELGSWFALRNARAAFVGGSLAPGPGGHNPLEPVRLGVPALSGPYVDNWAEVYAALGDDVARVQGTGALAAAFDAVLDDPAAARARAARAQARAQTLAGGLDQGVAGILALALRPR